MGTQQFCLKWNNHQTNMLNVFEQLLSSEALVDVTLACEGLSLKAHKMVLSACSPFFQSLFLENPCKHPIVIMKDMKYTDLKAIVDFMYRGEVNVSQDQLSALLKTAETLKVKGLAEVTGDNRHGPGGLVQQEIIQQHLVNTPQSLPPSGAQTQHRAESPPLSRRKRGRPRRRSLSGSNRSDSEDQVPSKIKEPDSPEVIEEVTSEVESTNDARQRLAPSGHPQSQVSTLHPVHHGVPPLKSHTTLPSVLPQQDTHMSVEEPPSGDEGDYDVEPSKLMEQTMTTENVPVFPDGPSQGPALPPSSTQLAIPTTVGLADTQSLHTGPGPCDSQSLVSCSMPSEPSTSVSQDNNQDIKPGALVSFEEPPISPVAGPSHQESSNSMMMYMDTSGVPAIPGPSSYQLDKQPSQPPQQQQPQGFEDLIQEITQPLMTIPRCENSLLQVRCSPTSIVKYEGSFADTAEPSELAQRYEHLSQQITQNQYTIKNNRLFTCGICNAKYTQQSNLRRHERVEHATVQRMYSCQVCKKFFKRVDTLRVHERTVHAEK